MKSTHKNLFWIWDTPVILLVLFPLLTGGFWFQKPGLFIELVELAIPVLLLSGYGLLLNRSLHFPLEKSPLSLFLKKIWDQWIFHLNQKPIRVLIGGSLLVGTVWALVSLRRHWSFNSGAADLGIFHNAIWNLTQHGNYVSSLKDGINLFQDHQSPIFWLFAPLYKMFPYAETLLISQAYAISLGAIPLFYLARQYRSGDLNFLGCIVLLYWILPASRAAIHFDFHPETLALPLFLATIAGLQSSHFKFRLLGGLALLLGLLTKESAGPLAVGLGIAWILGAGPSPTQSFSRKLGLIVVLLGFAVFYFDTKVVPGFFGSQYVYNIQYRQFGESTLDILLSPFLKPALFFSHILEESRLRFLFWTIAPLGFLPLLGWRALWLALPSYLILFLSEGNHRVSMQYHYAIEPSIGLLWAFVIGFTQAKKIPKFSSILWIWILFWSLVTFGRSDLFRIRYYQETAHHTWLKKELFPCLTDQPLSASGSLTPHLANRKWIHHLPQIEVSELGQTNQNLPAKVSCVLYDSKVNNWPMATEQIQQLPRQMKQNGYHEIYRCGSTVLYSQKASENCLQCTPQPCTEP